MIQNTHLQDRLLAIQSNMLNFAYLLTSNRDDAYDLLQDTTIKVLDNQEKYVENTNFKGWVFTIMRNIFINNYRRTVRHGVMIDNTEESVYLNLPQDSGLETPEGSLAAGEITTVINNLNDDYRIPFTMHVQGFKYNEIAQKTGLALGTVKSRIFFARQRLQKALTDYRTKRK